MTGVQTCALPISRLLANGRPAATAPAAPIASRPQDGFSLGADTGSFVGGYESALPWHGLLEDARVYWGEPDPDALEQWSRP